MSKGATRQPGRGSYTSANVWLAVLPAISRCVVWMHFYDTILAGRLIASYTMERLAGLMIIMILL